MDRVIRLDKILVGGETVFQLTVVDRDSAQETAWRAVSPAEWRDGDDLRGPDLRLVDVESDSTGNTHNCIPNRRDSSMSKSKDNSSLFSSDDVRGPVECLGMKFPPTGTRAPLPG